MEMKLKFIAACSVFILLAILFAAGGASAQEAGQAASGGGEAGKVENPASPAAAGETGKAAPTLKASTARPMFSSGAVIGGIGWLLLAPMLAFGFWDQEPGEGCWPQEGFTIALSTLAPGGISAGFSLVGNGLMLGAQARALKTLKSRGKSPSRALFITGAVLTALTGAAFGLGAGLGVIAGDEEGVCYGYCFIPYTILSTASYAISIAGWVLAAREVKALEAGASSEKSSPVTVLPFVGGLRGGAAAGVTIVM